jgi:hypothetical protein
MACGAVYVMRCISVEVESRSHKNCMEEVPVMYNRTEVSMDPISSSVDCHDVALSTYKLGGKWYCTNDPALLPVDDV